MGLLTNAAMARLAVLDSLCLAVIGIAAGSELHLSELRKNPKPVLFMTLCITAFSWLFIFAAGSCTRCFVSFIPDDDVVP